MNGNKEHPCSPNQLFSSITNVQNANIINCFIGVASKDNSEVSIRNSQIIDSKYSLAVYQKKPEYGPSKMSVTGTTIKEGAEIVEEKSELKLDNQEISQKSLNVYNQLYN